MTLHLEHLCSTCRSAPKSCVPPIQPLFGVANFSRGYHCGVDDPEIALPGLEKVWGRRYARVESGAGEGCALDAADFLEALVSESSGSVRVCSRSRSSFFMALSVRYPTTVPPMVTMVPTTPKAMAICAS